MQSKTRMLWSPNLEGGNSGPAPPTKSVIEYLSSVCKALGSIPNGKGTLLARKDAPSRGVPEVNSVTVTEEWDGSLPLRTRGNTGD